MGEINLSLLGKRIQTFRKVNGLSQFQLAELSQVSTVYISNIENGKTLPSLKSLSKIADALNVTFNDLLNETSYDTPDKYTFQEKQILFSFLLDLQNNLICS